MNRLLRRAGVALAALSALAGAALAGGSAALAGAPESALADLDLPGTWSVGEANEVPADPWWTTMGPASLQRVVDAAVAENLDLTGARARVDAARANQGVALAPLLPQLTANARWSANGDCSRLAGFGIEGGGGFDEAALVNAVAEPIVGYLGEAISELGGDPSQLPEFEGPEPAPPPEPVPCATWGDVVDSGFFTVGTLSLDLAWNLDVTGRSTLGYLAAQNERKATELDTSGQASTVAGLAARAWLDAVTAKARVAVVQEQVALNEELLEITELRYRGGDAGSLDVLQQRQQLASTRALLPTAEFAARAAELRLATLLGRSPGELGPIDGELPPVGPRPGLGTPADVLDNVPAVEAARARLVGATQRHTSTGLALAPTVGVTASLGQQTIWFADFEAGDDPNNVPTVSGGLNLSLPLWQGGRNYANLRAAAATARASEAAFQSAVLVAVQAVETGLAADVAQEANLAATAVQLAAAEQAFETAKAQYLAGATPYLNVQNTLRTLQGAQLTELTARRDRLDARIQLHEALGGPWAATLHR